MKKMNEKKKKVTPKKVVTIEVTPKMGEGDKVKIVSQVVVGRKVIKFSGPPYHIDENDFPFLEHVFDRKEGPVVREVKDGDK